MKPPDFTTPSRQLTIQEIEQYWSQWKHLFSSDKDRFWDGLLSGLNNYLQILQGKLSEKLYFAQSVLIFNVYFFNNAKCYIPHTVRKPEGT